MPVKCRKCGGDHFTNKCGKEKEVSKQNDSKKTDYKQNDYKKTDYKQNDYKKNNSFDKKNKPFNKRRNNFNRRFGDKQDINTFRVKIYNIPSDLTLQNLNKMMIGWGKIGNIRINKRGYNISAVIDFYDKDAREYFIEAVNGTPVGFMLLQVTK